MLFLLLEKRVHTKLRSLCVHLFNFNHQLFKVNSFQAQLAERVEGYMHLFKQMKWLLNPCPPSAAFVTLSPQPAAVIFVFSSLSNGHTYLL